MDSDEDDYQSDLGRPKSVIHDSRKEVDDFLSNVDRLKCAVHDAQKEVKSNNLNYDAHIKLISSLSKLYSVYKSHERKACDENNAREKTLIAFNKLRYARKNMSAVFPLSIELWLNWIEDELSAPSASVDHNVIEEIFEKATADYLSVDIWCHHMNYLIDKRDYSSSGRVSKKFIRDSFERAVTNCGLHYTDGHKIWELYQRFEIKILLETERKLREKSTPESIENYKAQLTNLIKLFKRQMHVPLDNHYDLLKRFTDTVEPYVKKLKSLIPDCQLFRFDEIKSIHEDTAEEIYSKSIVALENKLVESQHSLEAYQSYICNELDTGKCDLARVQCLFERAIVYHCLRPSVWLDYINFLNDMLKQYDLALSITKRALRNVTWDASIYLKYVNILEQTASDLGVVRNAYQMGLDKYCNNGLNYCFVLMSFLSFEKRICDSKAALIKKKPRIYELIQKALHHFEVLIESEKFVIEFMIFWINIESFWFEDKTKSEIILKYFAIKYRKNLSVWYQVIVFARALCYKSLVNELLDVCLQECPDSFEQCGQSWLNFENIFGTVSSRHQLEKKINIHLPNRIQAQKNKEIRNIKAKVEHQSKFLIGWLKRAEKQLFNIEDLENSSRHIMEDSTVVKNINQKIKKEPCDEEKLDKEGEKKIAVKRKHEDSLIKSENSSIIGPVMPPGFLQSNSNEVNTRKDDNNVEDDDSDQFMAPPRKVRFTEKSLRSEKTSESESDDQERTVYVSNLHPATTESDLKIIFGRAGSVEKIDLHKQKGGKIFAFVTYSNPEDARIAFELEHTPIRNRPVYVSKFNRSKEKQNSGPQYSQSQEKNKLYVTNLDKSTMPNDLEKLFNRHGDMISLRLINKKGSSKPFAYVEYKTEDDAAKYRSELSDAIVRGRKLVVEFSNPGRANQTDRQKNLSTSTRPNAEEKKTNETVVKDKKTINSNQTERTSDDNVSRVVKKTSSTTFGFIPLQARNPKSQQPLIRKPKGPAVRIEVTPPVTSTKSNEDSTTAPGNPVSPSKPATSASKSNDDFRKMLLNN